MMPGMNSRDEDRDQRQADRHDGEGDLPRAEQSRLHAPMPRSTCASTFSIITMASSTTKPTEIVSAISDRLSIENPAAHMAAQEPTSDSGTVIRPRTRAKPPQEQKDDRHHQTD